MLLIDKQQYTTDEVANMYGLTEVLKKIRKDCKFEINPTDKKVDKLNGGFIHRALQSFPASFFAREKNGKTTEIRYTTGINPTTIGDKIIDKYDPTFIEMRGHTDHVPDEDKALYMYLFPTHENSPFRDQAKKWSYSFVDNQKRAENRLKQAGVLGEALTHANKLSGTGLRLIAKGMGVDNVDIKDELTLRADLTDLAQSRPAEYLSKVDSQLTYIDGLMEDAIDKGIFSISDLHGIKRWIWGKGPRDGETIVDISNQTQDVKLCLKSHIKLKLEEFMPSLTTMHEILSADDHANAYLNANNIDLGKGFVQSKEIRALQNDEDTGVDMSAVMLPANFQDAVTYLEMRDGKRPSNKVAKDFLTQVQEGKIS